MQDKEFDKHLERFKDALNFKLEDGNMVNFQGLLDEINKSDLGFCADVVEGN